MTHSAVVLFLWLLPQQAELNSLIQQASELQAQYKEEEALRLYETALEQQPAHLDALVGASWLASTLSTYQSSGEAREALCSRALAFANRAYELAPEDPSANLVMASATGGMALLSGVQERVRGALDMKHFLDRAVAGKPDDSRAWYVLARWSYRIAAASALEKAGAQLVGAELPDVSMEEAVDAYRKAVALNSDSILYRWEFAQALEAVGEVEEAVEQLKKAAATQPRTPRDPGLLAQLRYRLKKLTSN